MAIKRIVYKTHEEWLSGRGVIGASDIGTIVGVNPYEDPYEFWQRKKGLLPPKEETFAMKSGHYLEPAVASFYHDASGRDIINNSASEFVVYNTDIPFIKVSPDRYFWREGKHSNDNKGILECKTTRMNIDEEDLPKSWICQLQLQLGICGMKFGSLAWYLNREDAFGYKDFNFVPDFYGWLIESASKFYTDYLIGDEEPEPTSLKGLLLKYPKSTADKVLALEDLFATEPEKAEKIALACSEYKKVSDEMNEIKARKEALEEQIKMCFDDSDAISYGGLTLATWKSAKDSEKFDAKALKAEHPDIAAQYTKLVPGTRRFLVK